MLKFFPGLSSTEGLAQNTIAALTFGLVPQNISIVILAIFEVSLGVFLVLNIQRKRTASLALLHMICTFLPMFFYSEKVFINAPFQLTLVGQFIFKNIIIIAALLILKKED